MTEREDFSPDWPHGWTTRDGRAVEIFTNSRRGTAWAIVGLIDPDNQGGVITDWTRDARYMDGGGDHTADLINAPAPKRRVRGTIFMGITPEGACSALFFKRADDITSHTFWAPEGSDAIAIPIDHEIEE